MIEMMKKGFLVAAFLGLSACGPLIGVSDGKAPARYSLEPPQQAASEERLPVTIMVDEPAASDALDGRRIALKPSPLEFKYYADARWTDRAPVMMQGLLVDAVARSVGDAGTETMPLAPDYRLQSRMEDFQAHYGDKDETPVVRVTLSLKLFSRAPLALVGSTRLTAEVPAKADRVMAITEAFNSATQDVLAQATRWMRQEVASAQD